MMSHIPFKTIFLSIFISLILFNYNKNNNNKEKLKKEMNNKKKKWDYWKNIINYVIMVFY